ncbi:MAG: hypothetical protein WC565_02920 [Parcubacteria group bacterium]
MAKKPKKPAKPKKPVKPKKPKLTQAQKDRRQAQRLVNAELNPVLAEITRQEERARADAARRQQFINDLTATTAEMAKGYSPVVQQTYQQAGANQATFGRGFSDAFNQQQAQNAGSANQILEQSGAPEAQQITTSTPAADVLYGVSGYLPASSFEREGAGWTSAAAKLPTTMASAGQQYLRQAQEQAEDVFEDIGAQRSQINLKRPGMIQEVLAMIQENRARAQQQQFENMMAQQAFGLDVQQQSDLNAYRRAQLNQRQQSLNMQRERLTAQEKRWAKEAGLSPSDWLKLQQTSGKLAEEAHARKTRKVREKQPNDTYKSITVTERKPKTYGEALAQQINAGIPEKMARQSLDRVYKPGSDRPYRRTDLVKLSTSALRTMAANFAKEEARLRPPPNGPSIGYQNPDAGYIAWAKKMSRSQLIAYCSKMSPQLWKKG